MWPVTFHPVPGSESSGRARYRTGYQAVEYERPLACRGGEPVWESYGGGLDLASRNMAQDQPWHDYMPEVEVAHRMRAPRGARC